MRRREEERSLTMGVGVLFLVRFMVAVRGAQVEMTPAGMCRVAICLSLSARLLSRLRTLSFPLFLSPSHHFSCHSLLSLVHLIHTYTYMYINRMYCCPCTVSETAAKNLAKNVDFEEWLALSKADDDATVDRNSLPWLPL